MSVSDATQNSQANLPVTLNYFLIEAAAFVGQEGATTRLFANGLQQTEVIVKVRALNASSEIVPLPAGTNIEFIPYVGTQAGWRTSSTKRDNVLPYWEGAKTEEPSDKSNGIELLTYYLDLPAAMENRPRMQIAARLTLPNGISFTTNSIEDNVPYGGAGSGGEFKSYFYLSPVPATRYGKSHGLEIQEPVVYSVAPVIERAAKVGYSFVTLKNPSTQQPVRIYVTDALSIDKSATHYNKATGLALPEDTVCHHGMNSVLLPIATVYGLLVLNPILHPRNALCFAVGMIAHFSGYLPTMNVARYSGMRDAYGNPLNLKVTLNSTDPELSEGNDPWRYTIDIDGDY